MVEKNGQVLALVGIGSVGKSTIARELLATVPGARMITSYTTRKPRGDEIPGEYAWMSEAQAARMMDDPEALWCIPKEGHYYGTWSRDVLKVLNEPGALGIMILVPDVLVQLAHFFIQQERRSQLQIVYLLPPPAPLFEERLRKSGRDLVALAQRHANEADWEQRVYALKVVLEPSHISTSFIMNSGTPEETAAHVRALLP